VSVGPFVARRALHAVVLLAVATLVSFLLVRIIPGDPAEVMLGDRATPEAVRLLRESLGLDRPLLVQYGLYLQRLAHGDLGMSIRAGRPVATIIAERLPATVELATVAAGLAVVVGLPLGVLAGARRSSGLQAAAFAMSLMGQAMPGYWLGLLLINVFAVGLAWLPVSGRGSLGHLVLPAVTLAAFMLGLVVRITRSSILETMGADYVRTARAKGLGEVTVVGRHALWPALIPVVTIIGLQIGTLLGGAVVTETIFGWPGVGSLAVLAVLQRDYPVVQALVLCSALTFLVVNLAVDVLYACLDPRVVSS
jgi:ABC-type dipeptide/oligopeptide/nickel transport system permease component